jgi:hypothetical protein
MSAPHVFVALSSHGLGHLAQVAPVLKELRQRLPTLRLTIQCTLPEETLHNRVDGDFFYIPEATDIGLVMANAMQIKHNESAAAYETFYNQWDHYLQREITLLEQLAPDVLLANIPYLPLAAADRLSIPSIALCSLNWSDILHGCGLQHPALDDWRQTMLTAYQRAALFLQPTPSMAMLDLSNTQTIGPIATLGQNRRKELNRRLGLAKQQTLALVALGGIDMPLPISHWPCQADLCWIVPQLWGGQRTDIRHREQLADITFTDLLCSCDVIVGKPGYGTFTEAVCNGKPMLYVERDHWPEQTCLVNWLLEQGNGLKITREQLEKGSLRPAVQQLVRQSTKAPPIPTGIAEAADCLIDLIGN